MLLLEFPLSPFGLLVHLTFKFVYLTFMGWRPEDFQLNRLV